MRPYYAKSSRLNKLYKYIIATTLLLVLITSLSYSQPNEVKEKDEISSTSIITDPAIVIDVAIVDEIYFSSSDMVSGDEVDVFVKVQNNGHQTAEVRIMFTFENENGQTSRKNSSVIELDAENYEFAKAKWITQEGSTQIKAEIDLLHATEENLRDNTKSTFVNIDRVKETELLLQASDIMFVKTADNQSDLYTISGKVTNEGDYGTDVLLTISDITTSSKILLHELNLSINAKSDIQFNVPFTATDNLYYFEFELRNSTITDIDSSNNRIIKEFHPVLEKATSIDTELKISLSTGQLQQIKQNDLRTLMIDIDSESITDEFHVIVGGITSGIKITPDQWKLNINVDLLTNLGIMVSTDSSIQVGEIITIEVLLYQAGNPSELFEYEFDLLVVNDYDIGELNSDTSSYELTVSEISTFDIGIDELNSPEIGNITYTPSDPNTGTNVTLFADISDESVIDNATLFYSTNGGADWLNTSMSLQSGVTWSGTIDAPLAELTLTYYINATDSFGNFAITSQDTIFYDGTLPDVPIVSNPGIVSSLSTVDIDARGTDNVGINESLTFLYYSYDNSTYYSLAMTQINGTITDGYYQATIPVTANALVYYFIEMTDLSGLTNTSSVLTYNVDTPAVIGTIEVIPSVPQSNTTTMITANITDDDSITEVTLFYNFESTNDNITMSLVDGLYIATIPITVNDTTVYFEINATDSFGHISLSGTLNYYSDGLGPTFDSIEIIPVIPNADNSTLVRSVISDLNGIRNSTLYYSTNEGSTWSNITMSFNSGYWEASMPAFNESTQVDYFLSSFDQANNSRNSSIYIVNTDNQDPYFVNLTQFQSISELDTRIINVTVVDNFAVDSDAVFLYYSYDNSSWFSLQMTNITGTINSSTFQGTLPPTSQDIFYYYILASDISGRMNTSEVANYTIDHLPIISMVSNPSNVSAFQSFSITANITDDIQVISADLYYNHNGTWLQISMSNVTDIYTAIIPAIGYDTTMDYYISTVDSYGHVVNTSTSNLYADGITPSFGSIGITPSYPNGSSNVTVNVETYDNQAIGNVILYYTFNGTWTSLNYTEIVINSISGRNPTSGYHYGNSQTVDYDTGPLSRLSIYTYSADSDTMYVALWGYRIDTNTWEQFYIATSRGTGYIPEFTWTNPIYEQWRITIYDSEYNDNYYYSYDYDASESYIFEIPAINQDVTVDYYVESYDITGNMQNTSILSYDIDVVAPNITSITNPGTVSSISTVPINATLSDSTGINLSTVMLYYSTDQNSWFSTLMSLSSGNNLTGIYTGYIPGTNQSTMYYYIEALDVSGLFGNTSIYSYGINTIPFALNSTYSPLYPSINDQVTVLANITSDDTLVSVDLYYYYSDTQGSSSASLLGDLYTGTIPATLSHGIVTYRFRMIDTFGHDIYSQNFTFISDGLAPQFEVIRQNPINPNLDDNVTIDAFVQEDGLIDQVDLFYSFDNGNTWQSKPMNVTQGFDSSQVNVLLVTHGQNTNYLTRNGFTFDSITESQFSSITEATLENYEILILEPDWSNYATLRSGLTTVSQVLEYHKMTVSIRVAGNGGSQSNIDFLGTDYSRTTTHNAETFVDTDHPFISGVPWSGNSLVTSYFNTWSSTDHGWLTSLPVSQDGYTEILQNANGISMMEYVFKGSHVMVDTLTSIDGGWGTGSDPVADNYINYLNYTYAQHNANYYFSEVIPQGPPDTTVQYYIQASDISGNIGTSDILSYYIDGFDPVVTNVDNIAIWSENDSYLVNATLTDNYGIDNTSVMLYYSYDNNTYFVLSMTPFGGTITNTLFQATIPATSQNMVYYYVGGYDISGLSTESGIYTYIIDHNPVLIDLNSSLVYPTTEEEIMFMADVSDDVGVSTVILHYAINATWYQSSMANATGLYQSTLPPVQIDGNLIYYVQIIDTFGNQINSSQQSLYVDGLIPNIIEINQIPSVPVTNSTIDVEVLIQDQNEIANATLYYSVNGTVWQNITMTSNITSNSGRDPSTGYYYGVTITQDYFTDNLERLLIYVYSSDADTIEVILWGYTDQGTWEQFYSVGSRGNGYLPEFTWENEIYDGWRIQIRDTDNNDNFYYTYEFDSSPIWSASIPGYHQGSQIIYYIETFDQSGNSAISSNQSYIVDNTLPRLSEITTLIASTSDDSVNILTRIEDYGGINASNSFLYYSIDNSTWYNIQLSYINGSIYDGYFNATIPAIGSEELVRYYLEIEDISGNITYSDIYSYSSIDVVIGTISPAQEIVLNGTEMIQFSLSVSPNSSTVEISYDLGSSWTLMTLDANTTFVDSINLLTYPEGPLEIIVNITVIPGLSIFEYYTFFIDRSSPKILTSTVLSEVDGEGQLITAVIEEAAIGSNFTLSIFYSYDNSTWYETLMYVISSNPSNATFEGTIPVASNQVEIMYYLFAIDNLGFTNQTDQVLASIDYAPVIDNLEHSGTYIRADSSVEITTTVSDDDTILDVTLYYTSNNITNSIVMELQNGNYTTSIPPALNDGIVSYYIVVRDNFLHMINSSINQYYADGIGPTIQNVILSTNQANLNTQVAVYTNINDINLIQSSTLYYSFDGSVWDSTEFLLFTGDTITGRSPVGGSYRNELTIDTYESGPITRLSLTLSTQIAGSLEVILTGRLVTTGEWVEFYSSSGLSSGQISEFTWGTPIYDQWRIEIADSGSVSDYSYSYDMDIQAALRAFIPASTQNGIVEYYIVTQDMANYTTTSQIRTYFSDSLIPVFQGLTRLEPVSELVSPQIIANITDNTGLLTPILHYSPDGSTWYATNMIMQSGNAIDGTYMATIPAYSDGIVSYYVTVDDYYDLSSTSFTWSYAIDNVPNIQFSTHFPAVVSLDESIDVTAYVTDDFGIASVELVYWINGEESVSLMEFEFGAYVGNIPGVQTEATISYLIMVTDSIGQVTNTSTSTIGLDIQPPTISYLQQPGDSIPQPSEVIIEVLIEDNVSLDQSGVFLFYSYDNTEWYNRKMQYSGGDAVSSTFIQTIPNTPTNFIFYFVTATDAVGLENSTNVDSYFLVTFPDIDLDGIADWTETNIYGTSPTNNDTDSDGLNDYDEIFVYNTEVLNSDTDADGMEDGWEVTYGFNPLSETDASLDADLDGLTNLEEYQYGTDPTDEDTDGDGYTDGWEIENGTDPLIPDSDEDTDGDGLTNLEETTLGTDPLNPDSDEDEMPDGWEVDNSFDPLDPSDGILDPDNDGLTNAGEYTAGTNPFNPDTDGDEMLDGWEFEFGTDPLVSDAEADPDGDTLSNLTEYDIGSNPNSNDTDGDLMPDLWEYTHGLEINNDDSDADPDLDELVNLDEYYNDTDPNNPDTESDGMNDGWEVTFGLLPHINDSYEDPDEDGLTNLQEFQYNTDPTKSDTDNDGMPDLWEVENNLDPRVDDADEDPDNDGLTNLEEYIEGTNPQESDLSLTETIVIGTILTVTAASMFVAARRLGGPQAIVNKVGNLLNRSED